MREWTEAAPSVELRYTEFVILRVLSFTALLGLGLGSLCTLGCSRDPFDGAAANAADTSLERYEMRGFSWVVDDKLAGMPRPGRQGDLDLDLSYLATNDISLLVSLTEAGTDPDAAAEYGILVLHLPVKDFGAPSQAQLAMFVDVATDAIAKGKRVGVHCGAGLGRTGTLLAAYFVSTGMSAADAIAFVRYKRPGSIETSAQEAAVVAFASAQ